jgi:hypothetical protein
MKITFSLTSILAGLALGICAAPSISAQAAPNGIPVQMVVTVEPHNKGSEIPTITRDDVMVYEGKVRDTVTDWVPAEGDHAALEYFILLDDSSSTSLGRQLDDLRQFINAQPATAKIGVAYMQNGMAKVVQNLTDDHALAAKALRLPLGVNAGSAGPYFCLSDLVKHWPKSAARREVLLVTDGIDPYYPNGDLQDPYLNNAIEDAQRAGVVISGIYTPGIGHFGHSYWRTYWGQIYLSEVSDKTGGESYYIGFTGSPVSFTPFLDDQAQRLTHQYLLTFLAQPPKKGGMQRVRITTEVHAADLVSAGQVYVPAAK